jgi:predicted glycogen debranching enzyme
MPQWNFASQDKTADNLDALLEREWLAVNGLGGYASSTVPGMNTRKYHGLLVAAMSPPVRRMVLLSRAEEAVVCDGWSSPLGCNEYPGTIFPRGDQALRAFSPMPYPRWAYQGEGWTIEKSLRMLTGRNAVVVSYTLLGGDGSKPVELQLRPVFALRGIHDLMYQWNGHLSVEPRGVGGHHIPATGRTPEVFFSHDGVFETDSHWYLNTIYRREQQRGYAGLEDVWNPGVIHWSLTPGQSVHFVCSTDPLDVEVAVDLANQQFESATFQQGTPAQWLNHAASQFVLSVPASDGTTREFVAANYPWSPPSPRQTLIGFTGLFLVTGRFGDARNLLLTQIERLRDGLLPTVLGETGGPPQYNGVDTSLWFINAVYDYLHYTSDSETVRTSLMDAVFRIVDAYRHGTGLGIGAEVDMLLKTNQPGVATTWMDAQADGWVVTPRGGKAVEVNALWYNAVRIAAELADRFGPPHRANELRQFASAIKSSFNRRFWNPSANCCYDVLEDGGGDPSIRPNQLLAVSLPFPVLIDSRHEAVVETVRKHLMTPYGPRTLSPADPKYRGHYGGDVVTRDRAQHQGSVFPWLLGAFATAYLRVHGRGEGARREVAQYLEPSIAYLTGPGVGQLVELFDGDAPHRPGGAIAAAASVAEVLRAWSQDVLGELPSAPYRAHAAEPAV